MLGLMMREQVVAPEDRPLAALLGLADEALHQMVGAWRLSRQLLCGPMVVVERTLACCAAQQHTLSPRVHCAAVFVEPAAALCCIPPCP